MSDTTSAPSATFLGFTNTAPGQVKAIIRFPPVHKRAPSPTFFHKPIYVLNFSIEYLHEDGRKMTLQFGERVRSSYPLPLGASDMLIPVSPGIVSMELSHAVGMLYFHDDNKLFGWTPSAPKACSWKFEMENISTISNTVPKSR